ncbi:MAG: hypothetical protein H7Z37_15790 [Pyrinomonadaceae bacterium]|nr:hypothetical protein [Pyrinomonadaceae bacterium]
MSVDFDLENSSQTAIESHFRKLARRQSVIEKNLQICEAEELEVRAKWQNLKQITLNRLEHLIMLMMPDSSEAAIRKLTLIFPDEAVFTRYLQAKQREFNENPENDSAQMFGNSFGSLREVKAALRDVLLKLNAIPRNIGEFGSYFQFFLNGKNEFYVQDDLLLESQSQKSQISQQLKEIREQMDVVSSKLQTKNSNVTNIK